MTDTLTPGFRPRISKRPYGVYDSLKLIALHLDAKLQYY